MRGVGRVLIAVGALLLLFVAYQLWGTGLSEARSQRELRRDFEESLATTTTTTTTEPAPGTTQTTAPPAPVPATQIGSGVAIIRIPRIGVDKVVVEGVGLSDLKKGPGHYPDTPMPGREGNAAIAGHRTTYGAPFYRIDELRNGDEIRVVTRQGEFVYVVDRKEVVTPDRFDVLDPTDESRLTLTTCNPRFSARQRLVVSAVLRGEAAPTPTTVPPSGDPSTSTPSTPASSLADPAGLSGQDASRLPAILWGLAAVAVAFGVWLLARRWRKWPAYLLGAVPFLVVLFVFFENVSRLLPANF